MTQKCAKSRNLENSKGTDFRLFSVLVFCNNLVRFQLYAHLMSDLTVTNPVKPKKLIKIYIIFSDFRKQTSINFIKRLWSNFQLEFRQKFVQRSKMIQKLAFFLNRNSELIFLLQRITRASSGKFTISVLFLTFIFTFWYHIKIKNKPNIFRYFSII